MAGMKNRMLFCVLLLAAMILLPRQGEAALYTYLDDNGVRHYTNVPADKRCRPVRLATVQPRAKRSVIRVQPRIVRHTRAHRTHRPRIVSRKSRGSYDWHIRKAAFEHQVDPLLIKAIIQTESNFDRYAISSHGAQGLMQLMPETARDLQVTDPFDPGQNISGGTRYIRHLLNCYDGDLALSLAAYNAGPGRVAKHGSIPRIPETMAYVKKVLRLYHIYQQGMVQATRINVRKLVTIN